jgi:hypothetical protein
MTERELQRCVLQLARLLGWRVAHFRPARTKRGWRTPVEADGAGWLDLVLCRGERLLFRELKGDGGRLSPAQLAWLIALQQSGANADVWAPLDWRSGRIEAVLKGEKP